MNTLQFANNQKYFNFLQTLEKKKRIPNMSEIIRKFKISQAITVHLKKMKYTERVGNITVWIHKNPITLKDVKNLKDAINKGRVPKSKSERKTVKPEQIITTSPNTPVVQEPLTEETAIKFLLGCPTKYKIVKITEEIFE